MLYQDPVWHHRKTRTDTTTEPDFDYEAWKAKHMAFSAEAVPKWVKEVKEKYGKAGTKFACVGYVHAATIMMGAFLGIGSAVD